jgi:hypothetical protein
MHFLPHFFVLPLHFFFFFFFFLPSLSNGWATLSPAAARAANPAPSNGRRDPPLPSRRANASNRDPST